MLDAILLETCKRHYSSHFEKMIGRAGLSITRYMRPSSSDTGSILVIGQNATAHEGERQGAGIRTGSRVAISSLSRAPVVRLSRIAASFLSYLPSLLTGLFFSMVQSTRTIIQLCWMLSSFLAFVHCHFVVLGSLEQVSRWFEQFGTGPRRGHWGKSFDGIGSYVDTPSRAYGLDKIRTIEKRADFLQL
ncbi:hypothetical protein BDV95DRAFT_271796 [Massariosphaeria phaeospora]|uniref:Uncharacterized protein n=1 Tax=Massariosphaeria phaeospora TaxID=100035 RepID=A0A7C8M168_9PLEO|nr:hypothetical protein BDV95DRAFT_271796 [Massariosphaeria phaeospora]